MHILTTLLWRGVACGSAAGEVRSSEFRMWCQGRLTHSAVLHHLVMSSLFQQDERESGVL